MKNSIQRKTAVVSMILIIGAMVVGYVLCYFFANNYYLKIKQQEMVSAYYSINGLYEKSIEFFDYDSIFQIPNFNIPKENYQDLSLLCEQDGLSMLIVSPSGSEDFSYGNTEILSDRLISLIFEKNSSDCDVLTKTQNYSIQILNSPDGEKEYLEMWGFLMDGSSFIYRCSYSGVKNSVTVTLRFYTIISFILLIAIGFVMFFVIKTFSDRLKKLAYIAKRTNEYAFETNIEPNKIRNDEIGNLGRSLNEISAKFEKTVSQLKSANLNLKNELKAKEKLEEARKKYMSDVSHELKTPIALINGYAEGLKEGIAETKEDRDYYCDVIIDEAEKMNLLIKRLSTLNQLEQGRSAVNLERFDLVEVIRTFLSSMVPIIEESGAKVSFENTEPLYVWSDEFLFEEVLVNYFNNALHHMDENKIIWIKLDLIEKNIRVTVYNTGNPIPDEELDKIWDKFYKVDKARTRSYGGSGLGLSIVKAIAESLDKKYGVYNTNGGVCFWIDIEAARPENEEDAEDK